MLMKVPSSCKHEMFSLKMYTEAKRAYKQLIERMAEQRDRFSLLVIASWKARYKSVIAKAFIKPQNRLTRITFL